MTTYLNVHAGLVFLLFALFIVTAGAGFALGEYSARIKMKFRWVVSYIGAIAVFAMFILLFLI